MDSSTSLTSAQKKQYGPYCSGSSESTTDIPQYVYDKLEIDPSNSGVSEYIDPSSEKYKPELYEGRRVDQKNTTTGAVTATRYVADIKKHTPVSLINYTPDIVKICIPKSALDSNDNLVGGELKIKTQLFNVIDNKNKTLELEFTVSDDNLIRDTKCSKANIVNNMFKIYNKTGETHYQIAQPNDPEYKNIDCGCNCLGDRTHVDKYRKTNNFIKSILDNVIIKTDNIMSQRNQELTQIQTESDHLLHSPDMEQHDEYVNTNLIDTNPFTQTDEVKIIMTKLLLKDLVMHHNFQLI